METYNSNPKNYTERLIRSAAARAYGGALLLATTSAENSAESTPPTEREIRRTLAPDVARFLRHTSSRRSGNEFDLKKKQQSKLAEYLITFALQEGARVNSDKNKISRTGAKIIDLTPRLNAARIRREREQAELSSPSSSPKTTSRDGK